MNALNDRNREADAIVDEALRTFPIQPAPAGIMFSVMRHIEISDPIPKFHPHWLDYALSLFLASMVGLVLLLARSSLLPPTFLPLLQTRIIVFWQQLHIAIRPLDSSVFLSAFLLSSLLSLLSIWVIYRTRHTLPKIVYNSVLAIERTLP